MEKRNPIILIHGLWNTSSIFSSITSKLDEIGIEYFAPTLNHSYGITSIIDLSNILNELILEKYGLEKEIDILGFSMGGIIGRYWLQKFNGYKRTRRLISIGSPHKGTLMAQLVPKYPFRGISEMKINSQGKIITDGSRNLKDLYKEFDLESPNSNSTTLGGYVMDLAKKIPLYGETINDNYFTYKVLSHSRKQILRLEITKLLK